MIVKAKHHFFIYPLLKWYVTWKMKRTFSSLHIKGNVTDKKLPVLLICNHISWWDGLWAYHVNQSLFQRKYFYMMKENQLNKNSILKYAGGYSINTNDRSIVESLNYTAELLADKNNLVIIFPQGEIGSMHDHQVVFKKGITRILQRINNEIQIVFLINTIDYHSNVKPTVYSFVKNYEGEWTLEYIEKSYNKFLKECISEQILIKS